MKNRKLVIIAFMLAAVLTVGIGYAGYTTALFINGTAEIEQEVIEFTEGVNFTNATSNNNNYGHAWVGETDPNENNSTDPATTFTASPHAGFHVFGMTLQGEGVQFTYTIANNSDYNVDLTLSVKPGPNTEYFAVTTSIGGESVRIPAGEETTVQVTVLLLKDAPETAVEPASWNIEYSATSVGDPVETDSVQG